MMRQFTVAAVALLALLASACSSSDDDSGSAPSTAPTTAATVVSSTSAPPSTPASTEATTPPSTAAPTTVAPTSTTTPPTTEAPSTTTSVPPLAVPIEVVDGYLLGIGYGSMLPDGLAALPQLSVPVQDGELPFQACTNSTFGHYWVTQLGALSIVWEGETLDQAHLTNWNYSGSEVDGVPLLVGRAGVTVGSERAAVVAAYDDQPADEAFDDIVFVDGSLMRFELEGETVVAMSLIDCGD